MVKLSRHDFIVLMFSGKKLEPDIITKITGIKPYTKAKRNELSSGLAYSSGCFPKCHMKSKTGYWNILIQSKQEIEVQFAELTKKFKRYRSSLIKAVALDSIEEAYIEVVVKPSSKHAVYSCRLRSKDLEFWASIGIDVIYSCWVPGWDKDIKA